MSSLVITKQTGNFFSLVLDSGDAIISEQNRLTTIGNFCNFKTANGANLVLKQNILYSEITIITGVSHVPTSVNDLWISLLDAGFFDGLGGGGSITPTRFTELSDTFTSYIGKDGQVLVVNESEQKIETIAISLFTAEDKTKLDNIEAESQKNVQANWEETDPESDAYIANKPPIVPNEYATLVYVNDLSPNTATIFDIVTPPITNDDDLKEDSNNLYIGTDLSNWIWDSIISLYKTEQVLDTSNFNYTGTTIPAGNNKTADIERSGGISIGGYISSLLGYFVNRNGSNTAQIGGFFNFSNAVGSNSMMWQLNASNGLDLWAYVSSTWTKIATFTNAGNLTANNLSGTNTGDETTASLKTKIDEYLGFACSDEVSNLATGLVTTFRMPYAMTLTGVRISLTTAPTISSVIVDVKQGGTSIFSTLVSIDSGELTSVTAATPAVISTTALTDDSLMTIHITQIGSGDTGKGLKLVLSGKKS